MNGHSVPCEEKLPHGPHESGCQRAWPKQQRNSQMVLSRLSVLLKPHHNRSEALVGRTRCSGWAAALSGGAASGQGRKFLTASSSPSQHPTWNRHEDTQVMHVESAGRVRSTSICKTCTTLFDSRAALSVPLLACVLFKPLCCDHLLTDCVSSPRRRQPRCRCSTRLHSALNPKP